LPFGEYGDSIDVLREVGPLRRKLPACLPGECPARYP